MAVSPPGVPQLRLTALPVPVVSIAATLLSELLWKATHSPPQWGVFDQGGAQVLFPDSVLEFSNRREFEISNYPVQDGSFASYNKVIRPFEIQLRFSKAGTESTRALFLASLDALAESILLYNVHTPERLYQNVNLVRYEVTRRGAKGAYFLTEVDTYWEQVIQVQAQYSTTQVQLPSGPDSAQPTSNVGAQQPGVPTSQLQQTGAAAMASQPFYSGSG